MRLLTNLDLNKNEIQNVKLQSLATPPTLTAGDAGFVYLATPSNFFQGWDGAGWVNLGYAHPSTDGNMHVPATGTSHNGNVLVAGATAGSFAWTAAATAFNKNYETVVANIKMNGTASVGSSDTIARADHVHASDTSRAPLASPALTGTPTAPTAPTGTVTTQIATTQFVEATVNGISVGGRNLLSDSSFEYGMLLPSFLGSVSCCSISSSEHYIGNNSWKTDVVNIATSIGSYVTIPNLSIGQKYIVSFMAKTVGTTNATNSAEILNASNGIIASRTGVVTGGVWSSFALMFTATETSHKLAIVSATVLATTYVDCIKVELGSIPSDWTQSPEDIQMYVDNVIVGGRNLVSDGNFENGTALVSSFGNGISSIDTAEKYSGTKSWKISVGLFSGPGNGACMAFPGLTVGTRYILSFMLKTIGGLDTSNYAFIYGSADTISICNTFMGDLATGSVWKKITMQFVATQTAHRFAFTNTSGTCTSNLDNVKLEIGDKATDWTPSVEEIQSEIDSKAPINSPTFTGTVTLPAGTAIDSLISSVNAAITATGTTQATATLISKDINVVTLGTGGVVLPVAIIGKIISIANNTGVNISVYPATNGYLDSFAINLPVVLIPTETIIFRAITSTKWVTNAAKLADNIVGGTAGALVYQSNLNTTAMVAPGTAGQFLKSNGTAAPYWRTLDMTDMPLESSKSIVKAATTANITLSAPQTIDGISVIAGDRVLVKNQTTASQNGIYVVNASTWVRSFDADTILKISASNVSVNSGTVNGGTLFLTSVPSTATLNTTSILWYSNADSSDKLNFFAPTTSAELAGVISDETGTGVLVFATSPALAGTPTAPTPANGTNSTQLATTAFVLGTKLNQLVVPTADVAMGGFKVTNVAEPISSTDVATKNYVDAARAGLSIKDPVRVTTTVNIALTAVQTIDGVVLVAGDRVLVKNQTVGAENGIYVVAAGAWSRSTDADSLTVGAEVDPGMAVWVNEGTTSGDSRWVLTTNGNITVGTTAMVFTKDFQAADIVAGTGITKSGNTISVSTVPVANGGTGGTTVSAAKTNLGFMTRASANIGDGTATQITVTHNLNTIDITYSIKEISTNYFVITDVQIVDANNIKLLFTVAPTAGQFRVVVIG